MEALHHLEWVQGNIRSQCTLYDVDDDDDELGDKKDKKSNKNALANIQ